MRRYLPLAVATLCIAVLAASWPATAEAQRRVRARGGVVFVGGYFYDPFFGPYPWWPRYAYPGYYPVYDDRANVRILATPRQAAVYVDGFYAGIVDDFDGFFQGLPLPPGQHEIALYLEGYRTARQQLYLRPAESIKLRYTMERLAAGESAEPPPAAPPVPPPPVGSYIPPRTPGPRGPMPPIAGRPPLPPAAAPPASTRGAATLAIRVQPADAEIAIDGERWNASDGERLVVQVGEGTHHVDVRKAGYRPFATDIAVRGGETTPLNVSLSPERPQ
jgi:hypothetical protein